MSNIDTARVFIPQPTDYVLNNEVYGERVIGYDPMRYHAFKGLKNTDDRPDIWDFYEVVSYFYSMDLSRVPIVRPYVQYVEYMKNHGDIVSFDTGAIEYLKRNCNTLIIPDVGERDYISHLYYNAVRRNMNGVMFDYNREIPKKFQNIGDHGISVLMRQIGNAPRLR